MNAQIRPSVTNPTLASVYQEIVDAKLILQPDFQRKFVWTQDHQEAFLDTILQGLPFPEIYVCEDQVDVTLLKTTKKVIDGQQRLTTIRNYIEGRFPSQLKAIPGFADLGDEMKKVFLSYQLVIRDLGQIDEATTREIFKRINLTKFKLDDVEIHNAVYDGAFIKTAKRIRDEVDLSKFGVFRESEFTRMADLYFIMLVMATLENGGYFSQDSEVERFVAALNNEYPNRELMFNTLNAAFRLIADLELPTDSMWYRKSNFFTLVIEVAVNLGRIPKDFRVRLLALEEKVMSNRKDSNSIYGKYYSYMYQATQGRIARVVRGELFLQECIGDAPAPAWSKA